MFSQKISERQANQMRRDLWRLKAAQEAEVTTDVPNRDWFRRGYPERFGSW